MPDPWAITEPSDSSSMVPTSPGARLLKAVQVPAGTTRVWSCPGGGVIARRRPACSLPCRFFPAWRTAPTEEGLPGNQGMDTRHPGVELGFIRLERAPG